MVGLTLEGGGAKGAYHIGAWKAFREVGLHFDGITGTSVGALNGALMVQEDFEEAWDLWYSITPQQVMTLDDDIYEMLSDRKLDHTSVGLLIDEIRKIVKNSGIDSSPLYDMVQRMMREEAIRVSSVDFGFVTFSLTDKKPLELFKENIPHGKMGEYLMASSYLPIFKERLLDGKLFLDGGFYNNLPANMLVKKGYREIYAVRLLSAGRVIKVDEKEAKVHYIEPVRELGGMLDFNRDQSRKNLQLGYLDTMKYLKSYAGRHYYLKDFPGEDQALLMISQWPDTTKKEICSLLGLKPNKALNRLFFEEALPAMVHLSGMENSKGYSELLLRIMEAVAESCEVDYLKLYTFQDWVHAISTCPVVKEKNEASGWASLIRASESLFKPGREKKKESLLHFFVTQRDWLGHSPQ